MDGDVTEGKKTVTKIGEQNAPETPEDSRN